MAKNHEGFYLGHEIYLCEIRMDGIAILCYTMAVMTQSIMTMTRISVLNAVNSDGRKVGMVGAAELLVVMIILTINSNDQRPYLELGLLIFCVEDQISF